MKSGIDKTVFPQDSYLSMHNGRLLSKGENRYALENISAPEQVFTLPAGYQPIGFVDYDGQLYIISCNGTRVALGSYGPHGGTMSYVAVSNLTTDKGAAQDFDIASGVVGWTKDTRLEVFARKDYDESVNLYICDGLNTNTVINTVHTYTDTVADPLKPGDLDQFKTIVVIPTVSGKVVPGGYLKPGNYFMAFRYTTDDLNSTVFMNQVGPFCVADDGKGLLDKDNIKASRSIELTLGNADGYKYTEVAVMRYFGETGNISTEMYLLDKRFSRGGVILVDGTETTRDITVEEILASNIEQDKCLTHVQHEGRYMGGNWKAQDQTLHGKLAEIAMRIVPTPIMEDDDMVVSRQKAMARDYSVINSMDRMKYKAGEIYPFGVSFIIGGKHTTDVYPICGYDSNYGDALAEVAGGVHRSISYDDSEKISEVLGQQMTLNSQLVVNEGNVTVNGLDEIQAHTINCTSLLNKIAIPEDASSIRIVGHWPLKDDGATLDPIAIFLSVVGGQVTVLGTFNHPAIMEDTDNMDIDNIPSGATHLLVNSSTSTALGNDIHVYFYKEEVYEETNSIMYLNSILTVQDGQVVVNALEETQDPYTINALSDPVAVPEGTQSIKISGRWFSGENEGDPYFDPWVIYLSDIGGVVTVLDTMAPDANLEDYDHLYITDIPAGTTHILVNSFTSSIYGNTLHVEFKKLTNVFDTLVQNMTLNARQVVDGEGHVTIVVLEEPVTNTINCMLPIDRIAVPYGTRSMKVSGCWPSGDDSYFFTPWVIYLSVIGETVTVIGTKEYNISLDDYHELYIDDMPAGTTHVLVNSYTSTALGNTIDVRFYNEKVEDAYSYYKGNNGLFRFPMAVRGKDTDGVLRHKLFYSMMGVRMNILQSAVDLMDGLDITGLVLMQGDRIVNCISQGVVLPLVDRLMAYPPSSWTTGGIERYAGEVIGLGDGKTPAFFPFHLDKVNNIPGTDEKTVAVPSMFMFPVHFFPGHDGSYCVAHKKAWGYVSPYFGENFTDAEGMDIDGNKITVTSRDGRERVFTHNHTHGDLDKDEATVLANDLHKAKRFAYISPDEMGDPLGTFTGVIRTVYKRYNDQNTQYDHNLKTPCSTSLPMDGCTNKYDHNYLYAIREQILQDAINFVDANIKSEYLSMHFVPENMMTPDDRGCLSRMRSVFEVFGDITTDGNDGNWFKDNLNGKTREQLMAAGVALNRLMFNDANQVEGVDAAFPYGEAGRIFQGWYCDGDPNDNNSLPLTMSNMSMKSCPYYDFESMEKINGSTGWNDCIVEKYKYDPDAPDVFTHFLDMFNISGEVYHPVHLMNKPGVFAMVDLYKGDVYAQTCTFRLNRFDHELKDNTQAAQWRHGQVAQLYMESFKNHNLRTVTNDSMFYPYVARLGYSLLDYAYASTVDRMDKESRSYNEGNHEISGTLRRYGIDTDIPLVDGDKPGRVYYSGKHAEGSYEDAYRIVPVGQYQDFGNRYGAIQKLISAFGELFCIFEHGIVQMYTNNKVHSIGDSSEYILGQTELLYDQTKFLFNCGTQHRNSIVDGNFGFYCVDWLMNKISYTSYKVTEMGSTTFITEDLCTSKGFMLFFDELRAAIGTGELLDIVSGYNADLQEVLFTFNYTDSLGAHQSVTLLYNELQGCFTGYVDYDATLYMRYEDMLLMYRGQDKVWATDGGVKCNDFFDNGVDNSNPFSITFYVNGMSEKNNLSNMEKEYFINHIFASDNMFKVNGGVTRNITWETTYQESSTDINADQGAFWKTPVFLEHIWHLPIDVQSSEAKGPEGSSSFNTFEKGSTLRGPWLKMTITYTGTEKIVLRNVTTQFNISKS